MPDASPSNPASQPTRVEPVSARKPRGITRARAYLDELAQCGPFVSRRFLVHRAEVVRRFVIRCDGALARAGAPAEARASLIIQASMLRQATSTGHWDELHAAAAEIATAIDEYLVDPEPMAPPRADRQASRPSAIARHLRRLWGMRNSEGVALSEAVAAHTARPDGGTSGATPA